MSPSLEDLSPEERVLLAIKAQAEILRRKNEHWRRHPEAFARDRLNLTLTPDQIMVIESVRDHKRTAVRSGNALGKTFDTSVVVTWFMECFDNAIVYTTAPSFKQVVDLLWKEIRSRREEATPRLRGTMPPKEPRWDVSHKHFAKGVTADSEEGFKGQHAENLLIVIDEAAGVPGFIWTAISTMVKGKNGRVLAIGNPTTTSGDFYDAFHSKKKLWHEVHMSPRNHPNIVSGLQQMGLNWNQFLDIPFGSETDEEIANLDEVFTGAVTLMDIHEAKEEWGIGSPGWKSIVMGEFPPISERTIISMAMVMNARNGGANHEKLQTLPRHLPELTGLWAGMDVAGSGRNADRSAIVYMDGRRVTGCETWRGKQIHESAAVAIESMRRGYKLVFDATGLGEAFVSEFSKTEFVKGRDWYPVNASGSADDPKRYGRMRDQLWFHAADYLRLGYIDLSEGLNDKDFVTLAAELTATEVHKESGKPNGQRRAETKNDVRPKLKRSPDLADAFNLALLRPQPSGGIFIETGSGVTDRGLMSMQF